MFAAAGAVFTAAALAAACSTSSPPAPSGVAGVLLVDGAPAALTGCRPGHAEHVFVEVDSARGTLRFGEGKLYWNAHELACRQLDRRWGGGVRGDGSAYFRGSLAFVCGDLAGQLALDCGAITAEEAASLAANRAAAIHRQ